MQKATHAKIDHLKFCFCFFGFLECVSSSFTYYMSPIYDFLVMSVFEARVMP
jgi:hypothetical protein